MFDFSTLLSPERFTELVVTIVPDVLVAIAILVGFWFIGRITKPPLRVVLEKAGFHSTLIRMLVNNLYGAVLLALSIVMAAGQLGINVTAALAGISVIGIAVGFAAQDSLANMISGFLIFWDKPFNVGDYLTVQDQYGRVVEITMRTTRIRTQQNTYVVIPNKNIIDSVVVNHTKHGETRIDVPVGIAYKESIPDARQVILNAVAGVKGVANDPAPDVVVDGLGGSSVDLLVRVWIHDPSIERRTFYNTLEASKLALDAAGIQIPYPHLQLFVDNVEDRVWDKAAGLGQMIGAARGGSGSAA